MKWQKVLTDQTAYTGLKLFKVKMPRTVGKVLDVALSKPSTNDYFTQKVCRFASKGRSGQIVDTLECKSVGICCKSEARFRGNSFRMISGKAAEYKIFWTGNEKKDKG